MSAIHFSEERLLQVIEAPVVSDKSTFVADKNEQVVKLRRKPSYP